MDDRASSIKRTTHKKLYTIIYLSNGGVALMVRLDKTSARTYAYFSLRHHTVVAHSSIRVYNFKL